MVWTEMTSVRLFEFPKMTSRTGLGRTARQAALATLLAKVAHFGLGPTRNWGAPTVVVFVIWGLTWLTVEKLKG